MNQGHTDTLSPQLKRFTKIDAIILSCILIIALGLRLYKVTIPLADFHSFRQVDTAAVARNFTRDGFNLLYPKYDDFSNVQSGQENPQGYRFVEFPLYNAMFAGIYKLMPFLPIEVYGRLVAIFFSLAIIAIIYYLVLQEMNRLSAMIASFTFAVMPAFVFFSRMVLPDMPALGLGFISIFCLYKFWQSSFSRTLYHWFWLSIVFFACALLVKPTVIFYGIVLLIIFFRLYRFRLPMRWEPYLFAFLVFTPFIVWRIHISQYPEGIPASSWLITTVNTYEGPKDIFFKPAFFRWVFMERIGINIMGIFMIFFFLLGIIIKNSRYLLHSVLVSALLYLLVFQGGNVQHEYYQIMILPALAIFSGVGAGWIVQNAHLFMPLGITYLVIMVSFVFGTVFSYYKIKDYYNYPTDLVQIASVIRTLTRPTDKIVTDRTGDTTLLYLADRKGAPSIFKELPELKAKNYKYLMTQNKEYAANLRKEGYIFVFENEQFVLIRL